MWSGGLFHYKKGLAYATNDDGLQLYHDVENNTLLNDVFLYIFHNLPSLQNMHVYRVTKDTDLHEFVSTGFIGLTGPPYVPATYQVGKELVAYLETLVAFTPYYRADDPRMSGKMETFYQKALLRYKDYPYDEFHKYISKKMTTFYERFGAPDAQDDPENDDPVVGKGEVVEAGPLPEGSIVSRRHCQMSGSEDEREGGEGVHAAAAPAAAVGGAAAAAEAAGAANAPAPPAGATAAATADADA